jgi:tRNA/tmRNA/rRNA uracil-C5-methylase (TrmA/RlmC/RlmD family)
VEINPQCEAPFRAAARRIAADARLTFRVAAAGSAPDEFLTGTDVVVVDPPRKGLESALLDALCRPPDMDNPAPPSRAPDVGDAAEAVAQSQRPCSLIYLSCGFPALERDCAALLQSGHWELRHCVAFLFFPGTDSLETLAVFCRR